MQTIPEEEKAQVRIPHSIGITGHVSVTLGHFDEDGELLGALPPMSVPVEALNPKLAEILEKMAVDYRRNVVKVKRLEAERVQAEREAKQLVQQALADTQAALKAKRAEITAETGEHPLANDRRLVALKRRRKKIQELQEAFTAAIDECES